MFAGRIGPSRGPCVWDRWPRQSEPQQLEPFQIEPYEHNNMRKKNHSLVKGTSTSETPRKGRPFQHIKTDYPINQKRISFL